MTNLKTRSFTLYKLSSPTLDAEEIKRFLDDRNLDWAKDPEATSGERLVEAAGRVCYMSFSSDTSKIRYPSKAYISNIITKGHESVLEHAVWTFLLDGVSRSFTHQLVRHRIGFSYSQLSQQYHDETDAEYVEPHGLSLNPVLRTEWQEAISSLNRVYKDLLADTSNSDKLPKAEARRALRSAARSILPNAISTTIVVTANARALRHFFAARGTIEGDFEMRRVAVEMLRSVLNDAPSLFPEFTIEKHHDGNEIVSRE